MPVPTASLPEDPAAMSILTQIRSELRPMLRIALPLVAAEIGWMTMGLVDTMMVGRLPNAAVAMSAVALAQILFNTAAFGLGGILLGLDTVISQAHGAGRYHEANRWLVHGLLLATTVAAFLAMAFALAPLGMSHISTDPTVISGAIGTLRALNLGILPLLLYFTLRRYLQAFNHVRPIAWALLSANIINVLFNWLLIYSHHWHFGSAHIQWSGLGVVGSGLATSFARTYLALFLAAALWSLDRHHNYGLRTVNLRTEARLLKSLLQLGLPAGATIIVEIAIFAVVTFLISTLGPVPLAGHEIALNVISFTFMIPMGISAAASVRVGQAIGRRSAKDARAAGWTALCLSGAAMIAAAVGYLSAPHLIARTFTPDQAVIAATVPLFAVAALFQLCDGLQVTAIGALRGAGDTHSGLITHLCTYWLLGLPIGIYLAFHRHLGARGLWLGLSVALTLAGCILLYRWHRVSHTLLSEQRAARSPSVRAIQL